VVADNLGSRTHMLLRLVRKFPSAVCACLDINQGGTDRKRCKQRLVILHAHTYSEPKVTPKPTLPAELPADKKKVNRYGMLICNAL